MRFFFALAIVIGQIIVKIKLKYVYNNSCLIHAQSHFYHTIACLQACFSAIMQSTGNYATGDISIEKS